MKFKVIIKEDKEDGGFNISCPMLPGCNSQGDTIEDALTNIKDAIQACLDVLNDRVKADKYEMIEEVLIV